MMGLMLVNGVCPRPGVIMWFEKHPIFGNEFISTALNKQVRGGERAIKVFVAGSTSGGSCACSTLGRTSGERPRRIHSSRSNVCSMNSMRMLRRCGFPVIGLRLMSRLSDFRGGLASSCTSCINQRAMGSSVTQFVMMVTRIRFSFIMVMPPPSLTSLRKKSQIFPLQHRELFGLSSVSRTSGPKYTWII